MALAALKDELVIWDAALEAFISDDFDGALSLFEKISHNIKIVMNIGLIHMHQGDLDLAIEQFTNAIKLDHHFALAYFQRGVCYFRLKDLEKAQQDFSDTKTMMRGNDIAHYQELGLEFELPMSKVLLNRGLARIQMGEKSASSLILVTTSDAPEDYELFIMPSNLLFHPIQSKRNFLLEYQATGTPSISIPFTPGSRSDSSSTYAPSQSDQGSVKKSASVASLNEKRAIDSDEFDDNAESSSSSRHLRSELIRVIGPDLMVPTGTEICTIPCAGVRIASGKLLGLMGWRLVVELDDGNPEEDAKGRQGSPWLRKRKEKGKFKENRLSVVSNFILDTGISKSVVAQEMLRALGYQGRYNPGAGVNLRIQGIRAQCTVAHLGEASKLGSQFMTSGNLTFYFDSKLNAPVLYVGDDGRDRPTDIPRTIVPPPLQRHRSWKDSVTSLLGLLKSDDTAAAA